MRRRDLRCWDNVRRVRRDRPSGRKLAIFDSLHLCDCVMNREPVKLGKQTFCWSCRKLVLTGAARRKYEDAQQRKKELEKKRNTRLRREEAKRRRDAAKTATRYYKVCTCAVGFDWATYTDGIVRRCAKCRAIRISTADFKKLAKALAK